MDEDKDVSKRHSTKEAKILTTFSIEKTFKSDLEELFASMGLGWSAGVRFALRDFYRHNAEDK